MNTESNTLATVVELAPVTKLTIVPDPKTAERERQLRQDITAMLADLNLFTLTTLRREIYAYYLTR